ncbi:hypothetical protein M408DRAFT_10128 [Serendipita vermifera MAFF 305830]|uniref:DNA polymerase beta-like N-terminal domain-containing protein n=1 Tax=Serendipita vermifera MAFF 305830 TaxID=933852 RepID=A0A0C2WID5_SERVB|nr:hypothetical protein M408DRAFT_10128 [Serendipita vermifera MAFF 305830]
MASTAQGLATAAVGVEEQASKDTPTTSSGNAVGENTKAENSANTSTNHLQTPQVADKKKRPFSFGKKKSDEKVLQKSDSKSDDGTNTTATKTAVCDAAAVEAKESEPQDLWANNEVKLISDFALASVSGDKAMDKLICPYHGTTCKKMCAWRTAKQKELGPKVGGPSNIKNYRGAQSKNQKGRLTIGQIRSDNPASPSSPDSGNMSPISPTPATTPLKGPANTKSPTRGRAPPPPPGLGRSIGIAPAIEKVVTEAQAPDASAAVGIGRVCSLKLQTRAYATRKPPSPESLNYPLLNKLYNEYITYSEGEEPNVHKIHAFKTAISAIDGLPFQVQRIQDVEKIKGIGAGMKRRIEEALLEEEKQGIIPSTNGDVEDKKELLHAVQLFQTVSGIGPMKAKKLAENGFRSLEDIMADKATFDKLSRSVQTSMKCGARTLARIQRGDITRLASLMSKVLKEFEVEVTGS